MIQLWFLGPELQAEFEAIAGEIAADDYWQEGWIAVKQLLTRSHGKADSALERLRVIENRLRPKNSFEQTRAVVLTRAWGPFDIAEIDDDVTGESIMAAQVRANIKAEELGKKVAGEKTAFEALLPDLVAGNGLRLIPFGRGLALATTDRRQVWRQLTDALVKCEVEKRNVDTFRGFLHGVAEVEFGLIEILLEEALTHAALGPWFPVLQSSVPFSAAGVERLKRAAAIKLAPVETFSLLGYSGFANAISGDDLQAIILSLAEQDGGYAVAMHVLSMRFESIEDSRTEYPSELISAGRKLLASPVFASNDNMLDYHMDIVARACLRGEEAVPITHALCEQIKIGFMNYRFRAYNHELLLGCIFQLQPRVALDILLGDEEQIDRFSFVINSFERLTNHRKSPIDSIPADELFGWCDEKPEQRYAAVSRVVSYHTGGSGEVHHWTNLATQILNRAPDPVTILKIFVSRFYPTSWSGSRATVVESKLGLLDQIEDLKNPSVADCLSRIRRELLDAVTRMREEENDDDTGRDERFE